MMMSDDPRNFFYGYFEDVRWSKEVFMNLIHTTSVVEKCSVYRFNVIRIRRRIWIIKKRLLHTKIRKLDFQ